MICRSAELGNISSTPVKVLPDPHIFTATVLLQIHPHLDARQICLPGELEAVGELTGQAWGDEPLVVEVTGGAPLLEERVAVGLGPLDNTVIAGEGGLVGNAVHVVHRGHRLAGRLETHRLKKGKILRLETL